MLNIEGYGPLKPGMVLIDGSSRGGEFIIPSRTAHLPDNIYNTLRKHTHTNLPSNPAGWVIETWVYKWFNINYER